MEVLNTTRQGQTQVNNAVKIRYNIRQTGGSVTEVNGTVVKNDAVIGYVNSSPSGELGVSFNNENNLSGEEKKQVFNHVVDDVAEQYTPEG
ncbi:MAG: hypothetical protein MdMp024_0525 [Bacteroidales bacterium]